MVSPCQISARDSSRRFSVRRASSTASFAGFEREMRHPGRIFDLFLQLGVLDHAFEQARARHQDVILLLFAQLVGHAGLVVGLDADRRCRDADGRD